jgi:hypothetical protein
MKSTIAKKTELGNLYQSREYRSWNNMKNRCNNSNLKEYKNYGGRGITYDKRWEDFREFYKDMGERPEGTSLDRIDVNGNYCKENCRWSTKEEQQRNQRIHKNKYVGITYDSTHTTCKWQAGISYKNKRYANRFKTIEEALNWRKEKEIELWQKAL